AQKTSVAVATLSHRKHLLLSLRFRTKNICWSKASADVAEPHVIVTSLKRLFLITATAGKRYLLF
ncbi:hypothetical protein, partial [Lysinibacillus agricola]|uniref:hypothetical protein n=1 Tax=Lysinibacillus agricola TaxID=2590012 RepID=UPI003C2CA1D4